MFKKALVIMFISLSVLVLSNAAFAQGRKMGLFVGINEYEGGIKPLKSCVNDAVNMQAKLTRNYGFQASNTNLLTDGQATRQGILSGLSDFEKRLKKGDLFVFYYSGHGSVFPDASSDDQDETEQFGMPDFFPTGYYDSAIVPVDGRSSSSGKAWNNLILDDELNAIFSRFTANGIQVVFISDSCHSGTLAKGLSSENKTFKFVTPKALGFNTQNWKQIASRRGSKSGETYNKLYLVVGSSQDNQFSRAGSFQEMSLFTKVLVAKLDEFAQAGKQFTYQNIVDTVNPAVDVVSDHEQTPRLDDRFYNSSFLNNSIFSLLKMPAGADNEIEIKATVTDKNNKPIANATFGVFRLGTSLGKDEIKKSDVLMLGRTDTNGEFDSYKNLLYGSDTLQPGRYLIKVVKPGYQAYISEMNVEPRKNNSQRFIFKLANE